MDNNNSKEKIEETINNISPFLSGMLKNTQGLLGVLENLKKDPNLTPEQRADIDKKLAAGGLNDLDKKFKDAMSALKNINVNADHKV